jgi:YD repeat-containing protein
MSSNEPICEYDSNGNEIYYKDNDGYEWWYEYDSNGKLIHFKTSDGVECWWEYDSDGKCINIKDSSGYKRLLEYDSNGKCVYYKGSDDLEAWFWEGKPTTDPIKILLLKSELCSSKNAPLLET